MADPAMETGGHKADTAAGRYGQQQRYSPRIGKEAIMRADRPLPPLVQLAAGGVAHRTKSWKATVCGKHIGDVDAARWISTAGRTNEAICGNCQRFSAMPAKPAIDPDYIEEGIPVPDEEEIPVPDDEEEDIPAEPIEPEPVPA